MSTYGLGKGLGALIPTDSLPPEVPEDSEAQSGLQAGASTDEPIDLSGEQVVSVPVDVIMPNPYQPRKTFDEVQLQELASSIKQHGIIQPLILTQKADG